MIYVCHVELLHLRGAQKRLSLTKGERSSMSLWALSSDLEEKLPLILGMESTRQEEQ